MIREFFQHYKNEITRAKTEAVELRSTMSRLERELYELRSSIDDLTHDKVREYFQDKVIAERKLADVESQLRTANKAIKRLTQPTS